MRDVIIYGALRTPRTKGKPEGSLATVPPYELIRQLADEFRARHGATVVGAVERLALGCVTQIGAQGGHIALVSRIYAALPDTAVALTLNNYCVSGMSAVASAARSIALGEERLALAGGVECMSQAPFEGDHALFFSDIGLAARLRYISPPIVADLLATQAGLTRAELDAVTVESHRRAVLAWQEGHYQSTVVPITRPDGGRVERDELMRPGLSVQDLARFGPAFAALGALGHDAVLTNAIPGLAEVKHLHAIPHCPPIADGAALLLLGDAGCGAEHGMRGRARIVGIVEVDGDPLQPFVTGFAAMERILARYGLELGDIGAIEMMEAFAAVPAKFLRDYEPDPERVNVSGGHLALGHPMGASGGVLMVTLLANMERLDVEWGIAVAHAVSGVGCAVLLRRENP